MIVLVDDKSRENEGDLVMAAEKATPAKIAFMAKFGRGLICLPITKARAQELQLPPMVSKNTSPLQCNFTVSVDAKKGVTTGISAHDRTATIRALLNTKTRPIDFSRPGHVFPLIAQAGGVLARSGHTEGALDLMKLAGLKPMAVICEIMGDDGRMLSGKKLLKFAKEHGFQIVSIQSLVDIAKSQPQKAAREDSFVKREVEASLPTAYGNFRAIVYTDFPETKEHVAIIKGNLKNGKPALVRIHSECLTGDVFHSKRCDCYCQLEQALIAIGQAQAGVVIYLRHEGRGIGLINKLKAYNLQDLGYDTVSANEKLGFKGDAREYDVAGRILADLGVSKVRLMTNNPEKITALEQHGIHVVERVPIEFAPRGKGERIYMRTKKIKMGHMLSKV